MPEQEPPLFLKLLGIIVVIVMIAVSFVTVFQEITDSQPFIPAKAGIFSVWFLGPVLIGISKPKLVDMSSEHKVVRRNSLLWIMLCGLAYLTLSLALLLD